MTAPDTGHTGQPQAKSAVTIRAVSWALLAMLLAFLTNNVLNLSFQSDTELRWNNPLPMLVYLIPMLAAILFAATHAAAILFARAAPNRNDVAPAQLHPQATGSSSFIS